MPMTYRMPTSSSPAMDVVEFLRTIYLGDRGCKSVLIDGWNSEGHHDRSATNPLRRLGPDGPSPLDLGFFVFDAMLQLGQQRGAAGQLNALLFSRIDQPPRCATPQQPGQRRVRVKNQPHAAARNGRRRSRR